MTTNQKEQIQQEVRTMTKEEKDRMIDEVIKEKEIQLTEAEKKREAKLDLVKEAAKNSTARESIGKTAKFIKEDKEDKLEIKEEVIESEVKFNYLDAKKAIADCEKEQIKINSELDRELSFAKKFGMTEERLETISELREKYNASVNKQLQNIKDVNAFEQNTKAAVFEKAANVKEHLKQIVETLKKNTIDKAVVALATLKATTERIGEANKAVMTKVSLAKEAYGTILVEDLERYNRKMISLNYSIDKRVVNKLEKQYERLEQTYQKKANVKEAFKNLGKAFIGKEATINSQQITEKEQERLKYLESQIKGLKAEMQKYEKEFEKSKEKSIETLSATKDNREVHKAKENKDINSRLNNAKEEKIADKNELNKRFEAAKAESKREKEKNTEKNTPTLEKNKEDIGERERE